MNRANPDLQTLRANLRMAGTAEAVQVATEALAALGSADAGSDLIEVLGFNNPGAAVAAVDGLIAIGSAAVPPLLAMLRSDNYGARAWCIRALAGIGDVRGLEHLERALAGDIGPSVRRAAARGLGTLKLAQLDTEQRQALQRRCLAALLQACADGEWVVRYAAVAGLEALVLGDRGESSDPCLPPPAISRLRQLQQDRCGETLVVRQRATLALQRLQDRDGERRGDGKPSSDG